MRTYNIIGFLMICLSLNSCSQTDSYYTYINDYYNFTVDTMSTSTLKRCSESVKIVDARTTEEQSVSRIKSAYLVQYDTPKLEDLSFNRSDTIVVYCTIGYRSEKIAEQFKELGFTNVFNLYGGILEWVNQGELVYSPMETTTNFVHTYDKSWSKWMTNQFFKPVY